MVTLSLTYYQSRASPTAKLVEELNEPYGVVVEKAGTSQASGQRTPGAFE